MRAKRMLEIARALLESDSSDDADASREEPKSPPRVDAEGRHVRRGGWRDPQPRQNPEGEGMGKWRYDYEKGFIWRLLMRVESRTERPHSSHELTCAPRVLKHTTTYSVH